jgi:twitching motility protein PilT
MEKIDYQIIDKKQDCKVEFVSKQTTQTLDILQMLRDAVAKGASDLHIKVPAAPIFRINGELYSGDSCYVTSKIVEDIFCKIANQSQQLEFYANNDIDFTYVVPSLARFRVNVQRQRGSLSIVFRVIPFHIPTIQELGLPEICKDLIMRPRGLIIVTGPTGSGKSSTLAAMIEYLNQKAKKRVITIEDPIEFIFSDKNCVISQRELGTDTKSFALALKYALRHDPDVIIVGEMRDLETISTAVAAAETGHLVLGTLHTIDAAQTVDRLIDMYPGAQQGQIRMQLSQLLEAVLCQTLIPKASGNGRIAAFEVMTANTAIRSLIREGKTHEIAGVMMLNRASGMQTLNQHMIVLVQKGLVRRADAMLKSSQPEYLNKSLTNSI